LKTLPAILILAALFLADLSGAQEFYTSLNNYNRVLVNPSWAGFDMETSFSGSYLLNAGSGAGIFNETSFTYDQYSPKLHGGIAFFMKQGLHAEMNTNTIEMGVSYALKTKHSGNNFIPAVYLGYHKPVKHWFVYGFDEWRNNYEEYSNIPGKVFLRNDIYKFGASGILKLGRAWIGVSGCYGFQAKENEKKVSPYYPFRLVAFYSQKLLENKNGVLSQKRTITPEIFLHYENGLFQVKSEILVENRRYVHSFFLQNNFSGNTHFAGGSFGLNSKDIQILFSNGIGVQPSLKKTVYCGILSFKLKLPKPWVKRLFPFKPID